MELLIYFIKYLFDFIVLKLIDVIILSSTNKINITLCAPNKLYGYMFHFLMI